MSITLLTARTQVRSNLDEASAADWSNTELNRLLNQRYHRVAAMVMTTFEDYYLATDLFNTTASQQEYGSADGVATDIFKIRRVEVDFKPSVSTNAPTRCLPIRDIDAISRDLGFENSGLGTGSSSNAHYYTYGHGSNIKFGFLPIPTETATGAGKIWYVKQLPDLSSDSDTFDIPYPERYYHLITDGATGDALRFGQQESSEASRYDDKFDRGLVLMQEELEDKISDEYRSIIDVSGDYLDFT